MEPKSDSSPTPDTVYKMSEWGENSQKDYPYIKNNVASLGYDSARMTQGFVLTTILHDDPNAFGRLYIDDKADNIKARQGQTDLLGRLSWEIGLEELPKKMKEIISKTKAVIERADWATRASFESSSTAFAIMKERINAEIERDEELKDSYSYYNDAFLYDPEFQEFMSQRPQE